MVVVVVVVVVGGVWRGCSWGQVFRNGRSCANAFTHNHKHAPDSSYIVDVLQCLGQGSSDLGFTFGAVLRFEWFLFPVNTWGNPTLLQAINAQRALLV